MNLHIHIMSVDIIFIKIHWEPPIRIKHNQHLINVSWCFKRSACSLSSTPASINTADLSQTSLKPLCNTSAVRFLNR